MTPDTPEGEDFESEFSPSSYRWEWSFLLMRLFAFISNIFTDVARLYANIAEDLAAHSNYKSERRRFREQAAREIEALVEGPKED